MRGLTSASKPQMTHLTSTTIPREGIAARFATQSRRIEYLIALDTLPPWSGWCMNTIETNMTKQPLDRYLSRHPIEVVVESASHMVVLLNT